MNTAPSAAADQLPGNDGEIALMDADEIRRRLRAGTLAPRWADRARPSRSSAAVKADEEWLAAFKVIRTLGEGAFSKVHHAAHKFTLEHVALKVMTKSGWDAKTHLLTSKEVSIMLQMRHPNVVCLFQTLETPARLALVLEYAAGGCLADVLRAHGALAEPCARLLLRQVASGLQHMHAGGVAHRDLKPDNVFLTHLGVPKIGDFGFSTQFSPGELSHTFCGSPAYAAPELFKGRPYMASAVDMWALGVLLHQCLTAELPFPDRSLSLLFKGVTDETPVPRLPGAGEGCQEALDGLLVRDPHRRWDAGTLLAGQWCGAAAPTVAVGKAVLACCAEEEVKV